MSYIVARCRGFDLFGEVGIEELYRRLAQARRMLIPTLDPITTERIAALVSDLEDHIAQVNANRGEETGES